MKIPRREFIRRLMGAGTLVGATRSSVVMGAPATEDGAVVPRRSSPIPPAPIRSWIPPPGTFSEFTLNRPSDVGMEAGTLANWCGGAWISDFGEKGGVAYHGGGEHSEQSYAQSQQAVYVLDCDTRRYARWCFPTEKHLQALFTNNPKPPPSFKYLGTPTNEFGEFPDGSPGPVHTYAGLCEMPAAWNAGAPALVRVCEANWASKAMYDADPTFKSPPKGYAATWKFDLTKPTHTREDPAIVRITGDALYYMNRNTPTAAAMHTDAPTCCIDRIREGWWSFSRSSSQMRGLSFTTKDGAISNFAAPGIDLARWSKMYHFADDDILCVICDEPSWGQTRFGTIKLLDLSTLPGGRWITILPALPADPIPASESGYMGPQWSTLLNCFVALDRTSLQRACRVWKLTPPAAGHRFTGEWIWTQETVISADGSTILSTDAGSVNGAWGRLVECVSLSSLVWTRAPDKKGQLIRLVGMT